jgi:hypothetical protein
MATQVRTQTQPIEEDQVSAVTRVESAVGASIIASGIGSLVLGLATIGAEASADFKTFLTWNAGVGPLSGKVGVSIIAFLLSWVIFHYFFQSHPMKLMTSFIIGVVLVVLGLLLTFPPVFLSFGT